MNDKFLYKNRPDINQNFTARLYQRLTVSYPEKEDTLNNKKHSQVFKWQYALTVFLITAGLLVTFSAPVRAKALALIRMVAGFNIQEQSESPLKDLSMGENESGNMPDSGADNPAAVMIEPTVYPVQTEQLPEALKNPPFPFGLPTWTPEGYTMDQTVGISNSNSWVMMGWNNPDLSEIELMVEKEYTGYNIPAGENSTEEITINGSPAVLVRGFWDKNHQWDSSLGIVIGWKLDDHFYRLTYSQREPLHNEITSIDDLDSKIYELTQMAESVKSVQ